MAITPAGNMTQIQRASGAVMEKSIEPENMENRDPDDIYGEVFGSDGPYRYGISDPLSLQDSIIKTVPVSRSQGVLSVRGVISRIFGHPSGDSSPISPQDLPYFRFQKIQDILKVCIVAGVAGFACLPPPYNAVAIGFSVLSTSALAARAMFASPG